MDSNPLLNPVGSLPPEVYWRRRAMAAVLAILVGWFAWTEINGHIGANAAPSPNSSGTTTPAPTTSGTPTPAPTPTPTKTKAAAKPKPAKTSAAPAKTSATSTVAAVPRCPNSAIKLTVSTDHTVYGPGVLPHLALEVENVGTTSCTIDVGTANRKFVITSGSDQIWSSSDCSKHEPNVAVFKAKQAVGYSHVWNRQRSSSIGCAASGTEARPGTYKVVGKVGGLTSRGAVFQLR